MKTSELSSYEQAAADFLAAYGITCEIRRAALEGPGHPPAWSEDTDHGNQYRVKLAKEDRAPVTFDYWGSVNDRKEEKEPTAYDVLACISGDVNCPETFADFCSEYGYDEDSRKAYATWERCRDFGQQLRAFFPEGPERDALCEIQ